MLQHECIWTVYSERGQSQKAIYCMIPLISKVQNRQIYGDRKQISGCLKWAWWGGGGGEEGRIGG